MDRYAPGSVKQDPATKAVAVKLPDGSPLGEWGFMTMDRGGGFARHVEVETWTDLGVSDG